MRKIFPLLGLVLVLTGCGTKQNTPWLGYIEGENALIGAPQPGWITSVAVNRGDSVKPGSPLFTLDASREIAARNAADAAIAAANAQKAQADAQARQAAAARDAAQALVVQTRKELQRQKALVKSGATPEQSLEAAQAAYDNARAQFNSATAQEHQAEALGHQAEAQRTEGEAQRTTALANLADRTVTARVAGTVQDIFYRQGEYAMAGVPIVSVLPPANIFVRFFVPETALSHMHLGDTVHIGCDGCPPNLTATVRFIASEAEYTPPIIYSLTNRQKLVFKAEARLPPGLTLRPGLPVDVTPEAPAP